MGRIPKGRLNKEQRQRQEQLIYSVTRNFPRRHESAYMWDRAFYAITSAQKEKREFFAYLDSLPQRFSHRYTLEHYLIDVSNIDLYYTKWRREDIWNTKGSLRRARQFERREGLDPFEVVKERSKRREESLRISRENGGRGY